MSELTGKIALVTGASRGLGYAAAKALAAEGAHVIALARTVGALEELDDEIKAAGGEATLVPLDITDDKGLERLGGAVHQRWGRLDLWLHTAAEAAPFSPAQHAAEKDVEKAIKTNAVATQRLIRVLDPLLRAAEAGEAIFCADPEAPARGAGRRLVDGAEDIKLWGDTYRVRAKVHTIGGLSAHGDQDDLVGWYASFADRPPVYLVHGEERAQAPLLKRLRDELNAPAEIARYRQKVVIGD